MSIWLSEPRPADPVIVPWLTKREDARATGTMDSDVVLLKRPKLAGRKTKPGRPMARIGKQKRQFGGDYWGTR